MEGDEASSNDHHEGDFDMDPGMEDLPYVSSGVLRGAPAQQGIPASSVLHSSAILSRPAGAVSSGLLVDRLCVERQSSSVLLAPSATGPAGAERPSSAAVAVPLSVAHVGPCLFRGGAEQQLIDLSRFLNPRRAVLQKCLVTEPEGIDPGVARDLACPVVPAGISEITQAFQDHDVVLCWGLPLDEWVDLSRPRRARGVHIAHGDSPWTRELLTRSLKTVDHAVAVSDRVRMTTCGEIPTTVILNGVDTSRLATTRSRADVRAEFGYGPEDFVVGFVGRFSPEKRPELLIRALQLLPLHFKALFIGWGPLLPDLLKEANDLVPGRCAFRFADRQLGDYYQAFDSFTLLSVQEGFALVFLEAMFCGLPVLATPVGAVPEVIEHRVNGIIVDGSPHTVAADLQRLEAHRPWAAGLGETARQYARQHGHARRMAEEYEALFERLVAARGDAPCSA